MKDERLEWFACYPSKLIGGLLGLSPQEQLVYLIVLLRIYDVNGPCRDDGDRLSRLTGLTKLRITKCLDRLFELGKLRHSDDGIMNPFAAEVLVESKAIRDERRIAGRIGGIKSGESRREKKQANQGKERSKASDLLEAKAKQIEHPYSNSKQDSLFPRGNRGAEAPEKVAMVDPPLDPEADYYRRGKEVLGASAGGMLTQLIRAKGGNLALARAAIETAATRGDARQYVGGMVRNFRTGGDSYGADRQDGDRLGAAGLAAQLRRKIASERAHDAAAGDHAGDAES